MNWIRIIRILPLFPAAWFDSLKNKKRSDPEKYRRCRIWSERLLSWSGLQLEISGTDLLSGLKSCYFVSNHQGTLDPAVIISALPEPVSFISKIENEKLPVLGRWAKDIDTIHFDRESRKGNIHMLRESGRRLKKGGRLLIFPEGTRSRSNAMNSFHPQALLPAVKAKVPIVPVCLINSWVLDKKTSVRKVAVCFGDPLFPEEYSDLSLDDLSEQIKNRIEKMMNQKNA